VPDAALASALHVPAGGAADDDEVIEVDDDDAQGSDANGPNEEND